VPIAIRGTRSILRAGSWFPRQGFVSLKIGAPISLAEKMTSEKNRWSGALQLRDQSRDWILSHCGEPDLEHERPTYQPPPT